MLGATFRQATSALRWSSTSASRDLCSRSSTQLPCSTTLSRSFATAGRPRKGVPKTTLDVLPPKKPLASFSRYVVENHDNLVNGKEFFSQMSVKWNSLSAAEKKKYEASDKDWEAYYAELEEWKDKVDPETLKELNVQRVLQNKKPIVIKKKGSKRPYNSFIAFLKEFSEQPDAESLTPPDVMRLAAQKWREMSDDEKLVYKEKAAAAHKEYLGKHGLAPEDSA